MTDEPVDLDRRRGMAAQKATDLRRVLADAEANAQALRGQQRDIEAKLLMLPAASWPEAAAKARYVLGLYSESLSSEDSRNRDLVAALLADFDRLELEP
jgi:hypothetical protein